MTFLTAETRVFNAHFPRFDRSSTIQPYDRLQIVGNIYTDQRAETKHVRQVRGQKKPSELINLVFLHAVGFTKESWEYWIEMFYDTYGESLGTVISLDAVNHGESYMLNKDKLGLTCSWEDAAKDTLDVLAELEITSNVIVIGHSMGGATALHLAAFERRLIDSVICIEPVAYAVPGMHNADKGRRFMFDLFGKINRYVQDKFPNQETFEKFMVKGGVARTAHPRVKESLLKYAKHQNQDGTVMAVPPRDSLMVSYGSSYFSTTYLKDQMKTIDCQVCHVVGSAATWNPPESVESIRKALPYVVKVDIENGQHLVAMERPEDTFEAVKPFISNRLKAIEKLSKDEIEPKIETKDQAQEYFWTRYETFKKEYLGGKLIKYNRMSRL